MILAIIIGALKWERWNSDFWQRNKLTDYAGFVNEVFFLVNKVWFMVIAIWICEIELAKWWAGTEENVISMFRGSKSMNLAATTMVLAPKCFEESAYGRFWNLLQVWTHFNGCCLKLSMSGLNDSNTIVKNLVCGNGIMKWLIRENCEKREVEGETNGLLIPVIILRNEVQASTPCSTRALTTMLTILAAPKPVSLVPLRLPTCIAFTNSLKMQCMHGLS